MHRSNVTGLVDRLEDRGLVRRMNLATDRRAINVCLSASGKKLIRQIEPHYHQAAEAVWSDTSPDRIRQLMLQLQAISTNAGKAAENSANIKLIK
jgi:DNA-binding MarR family transcriptional regulator